MVKKHWFVISYLFAFLSVYAGSVVYALAPSVLGVEVRESAFTTQMNTTVSSVSGNIGTSFTLIAVALIVIAAIFVSRITMGFALVD